MPKFLRNQEVYQCELCHREYVGDNAKKQAEQCEKQGIKLPLYPRGTKVRFHADDNIYIVTCAMLDKEDDAPDYAEAHHDFVYCLAPSYNNGYPLNVVDEQSIEPIGKVRVFANKPRKVNNWEEYYKWDAKMFGDIPFPRTEIDELFKIHKNLASAQP